MPTLDVERARRETPGCAEAAYLNNAGSAPPPRVVLERMVEHLRLEARLGGYEAACPRSCAPRPTTTTPRRRSPASAGSWPGGRAEGPRR